MKKESLLKCFILMGAFMLSFFVFSSAPVEAVDYNINDNKITLSLEPVDGGDLSLGYNIVGATTTCDDVCVTDWQMPSDYNSNPIVGIMGGESVGVLDSLSGVISGKVIIGENIATIGEYAFHNFDNVTEIVLGEKVAFVKDYAFSGNESLSIVSVNAYNDGVRTKLNGDNVFFETTSLSKIVFKNATIAQFYMNNVSGWDSYFGLFTFKITYRFYNEDNSVNTDLVAYSDEKIGAIPNDLEKVGFDFKWVSKAKNTVVITPDTYATSTSSDVIIGEMHEVVPFWEMKKVSHLYLKTTFLGNVVEHKDVEKQISVNYSGKINNLDIGTVFEHELKNQVGFTASYSWSSNIGGLVTEGISTNSAYSVNGVANSGIYTCVLTIKYIDDKANTYENASVVSINVKILSKTLIINIKDKEVEYGTYVESEVDTIGALYTIDESTPLIGGESIKVFNYDGYENKSGVGEYSLTGEVVEIGYDDDLIDYKDNYSISYNYGKLTISPKNIQFSLLENIEVEYGEPENFVERVSISDIYGKEEIVAVKLTREDSNNKNVGVYELSGVVTDDSNYIVSLSVYNVGKVVIKPKAVSVVWNVEDNFVYNGNTNHAAAYYEDVENKKVYLNVEVLKNGLSSEMVNAGEYQLRATENIANKNYEIVENEKTVFIAKAESNLIGSQWQTAIYNGYPQNVTVELNHDEGEVKYGDYSSCIHAHVTSSAKCVISAYAEETENYTAISANFYLHIEPYKLQIEPAEFEFMYGIKPTQSELNSKYDGVNDEKVTVYFSKESIIGDLVVGEYDIVGVYLTNNTDYSVSMIPGSGKDKIKIVPSPVEINFYFYDGLVYDGRKKTIPISYSGTSEDVGLEVVCSDNANVVYSEQGVMIQVMNAGNYDVNVKITNNNFYIKGNSSLLINVAKADYDISGLKLNDKKVRFNFKNHFINLEGKLPNGLRAIYTIDDNHGNGTSFPFKHTVKVSFDGDFENYNYVEPMSAVLEISMAWVWWTLALIIVLVGTITFAIIWLVKHNVLKFRKRVRRKAIKKLAKMNKELDSLNEMLKSKREDKVSENVAEEKESVVIIEEPVKFVKQRVEVSQEEMLQLPFVDKLFQSEYGNKQLYSEVKNELLSYEGIVSKIKRDYETFYLNNMPIAKLDIVKGELHVYLALDPNVYKSEEYHHEDASKDKDFAVVPLKLVVNSVNSLRHAKMFIRIIRKKEGIKAVSNFVRTDYVSVYTAKDSSMKLFKKVRVKKNKGDIE